VLRDYFTKGPFSFADITLAVSAIKYSFSLLEINQWSLGLSLITIQNITDQTTPKIPLI